MECNCIGFFRVNTRLVELIIHYLHVIIRDNSKLCSCGGDRQIFYWDVATGRVIRKFRGHDGEVSYPSPIFHFFHFSILY